jgi:cytochrome c peroxidase
MKWFHRCIPPALLTVLLVGLSACSNDPSAPERTQKWPAPQPVTIDVPQYPPSISGFETPKIPPDNPTTQEGIALGRRIFFDPILSADSTQACASCHRFGQAYSEPQRFSIGIDDIEGTRNAPHLTNAAWLPSAFWDGRAASLEAQAVQPVENPIEMHETWGNVVAKLQSHPDYPELFGRAFGTDQITRDLVVKAVAQFERTFVSGNSKYDKFLRGEVQLTQSEHDGFTMFFSERGDCFHCHGSIMLTDHSFRNIGLDSVLIDLGRGERTGNPNDMGKFKVPSLRNVEVTAPYMHDGRFQTLEEVVNHYNSGGFGTPTVDALIRVGTGLGLTQQEVDDIVAFLKTFTDDEFLNNPDLGPPPSP